MEYLLISTQEELNNHCKELAKAKYIAIDTEFMRSKTYYSQLCLVQIAYRKGFAIVIDALAGLDLEEIIDVIYDPNIVKIFHGARQDLEIFYNRRNTLPKNIFDTQGAVVVLNYQKDLSYEKLVKSFLDKPLDKSFKTSNWAKRPLSEEQVKYAAYDSLYLYDLYEKIIEELKSLHREHWIEGMFSHLESNELYQPNIEKQLSKLASSHFSSDAVIIARRLLEWRENIAKNLNLSRNLVLHVDAIKSLSLHLLEEKEDMSKYVSEEFFTKYGDEIFLLISQAKIEAIDSENSIPKEKIAKLTIDQQELMFLSQLILKQICGAKNINNSIVATNEDLTNFILNNHEGIPFLSGWRFDIFGKILVDFFDSKASISIKDNEIIIT